MKRETEGEGPSAPAPDKPRGTAWMPNRERLKYWTRKIGHFGIWQIAFQGLQMLTGLLLANWLSIEAYSKYGVALSFQNMLNILTDLGITGSIIALVGDRIHDRELVGRFTAAALSFRNVMLLTVGPLSAVGFFWLARSHHWPLGESISLLLSIFGFLFFQGWTACYTSPLVMHVKVGPLYRPGVILNVAKLLACGVLHIFSALGAAAVCWINALSAFFNGLVYRRSARPYVDESAVPDAETKRAMRKYVSPLILGTVFYAFQGQIQVLLITVFGKNRSIAEITALGRFSQLFLVLLSFNGTVLFPFIARVPFSRLAVRFIQAVAFTVGMAAALTAVGFIFPGAFLWLLGSKYAGLHRELGMSILVSSVGFLNGALYGLNNARKWVYHWSGTASVVGTIAIQAVLIAGMDLSTTYSVIVFSFVASAYSTIILFATAIHGYRRDRAEMMKAAPAQG